jgi:hypothetical protein
MDTDSISTRTRSRSRKNQPTLDQGPSKARRIDPCVTFSRIDHESESLTTENESFESRFTCPKSDKEPSRLLPSRMLNDLLYDNEDLQEYKEKDTNIIDLWKEFANTTPDKWTETRFYRVHFEPLLKSFTFGRDSNQKMSNKIFNYVKCCRVRDTKFCEVISDRKCDACNFKHKEIIFQFVMTDGCGSENYFYTGRICGNKLLNMIEIFNIFYWAQVAPECLLEELLTFFNYRCDMFANVLERSKTYVEL